MKMQLEFQDGHLFLDFEQRRFLVDTGAPTSFGQGESIQIDGRGFDLPGSYMGLTPEELSGLVGYPTAGILGADILNAFDVVLDVTGGEAILTEDEVSLEGEILDIEGFMGIPIVRAEIVGSSHRMFFDTGAQVSYFQSDALSGFPEAGAVDDFYPGIGAFQTETYTVDVGLGDQRYALRCGALPGLLGMTLMMAGADGIIGNEVMKDRTTGYFPRRNRLVLS